MPAELAAQRPLLERAATGDRESFARLYDTQVDGVYRYLLAWTGNRLDAAELTSQVFHSAIGWLPATTGTEGEAGAWLIAMARDALTHHPARVRPDGVGGSSGSGGASEPSATGVPHPALSRLSEPEREVVVLRLLLGHSLDHTAHLSGYSRRAAMELQLAACLASHELTAGTRVGTTPPDSPAAPSAEEFERRLGRWEAGLTGSDPALADPLAGAGGGALATDGPSADTLAAALAVARLLRGAAPGLVTAPAGEFVQRLRADLVAGSPLAPGVPGVPVDSRGHHPLRSATVTLRGPQQPKVADPAASFPPGPPPARPRSSRTATGIGGWFSRRPWVATGVATAGIVVALGLQAFGGSGGPPACGGRPCPAPTTVAVAAGGGSTLGTPLTTVVESSTTSSTVAGDAAAVVPPTAAPRTSAATVPPSTRPVTTTPPTTRPRPTTTTVPTTTAPPTTAAPTTTTVAPAPT